MKKKSGKLGKLIRESIVFENGFIALLLGLTPILAASTRLIDALVMGVSAIVVLTDSAFVSALFSKTVPNGIKTAMHITVAIVSIAVIELLLRAFAPTVFDNIGMYLPLLAVSGVLLYSFEKEKRKKKLSGILTTALVTGGGFFATTFILAFVREFFGRGSLFGFQVLPEEYGMRFLTLPGGGLILLGVLIAVLRAYVQKIKKEGRI